MGVALSFLALALTSCERAAPPRSIEAVDVSEVFRLEQQSADVHGYLSKLQRAPRTDPNWPTLAYLVGEALLRTHQDEPARTVFRELCTWAAGLPAAAPHDDGWGASGLVAVALWRWLQILDAQGGSAEEIDQALKVAQSLYNRRLFVGMVHIGLLPALPLVEEDGARLLAHVLWKAGRPEASAAYLAFVSIDSVGDRDAIDDAITRHMIEQGLATPARLDLFRYRRQLGRLVTEKRKDRAADALLALSRDRAAPDDVRAQAVYEWANHYRRHRDQKNAVIDGLTQANELERGTGLTAEKAVYLRGMVQNSVEPRDPAAFFADMARLIDDHPHSPLRADALYQTASEKVFAVPPDIDGALTAFAKLRLVSGVNEWMDSAYFLPAAALFDRGAPGDLGAADQLLADYAENFPDGPFRWRSLFWRGRIQERMHDDAKARVFFQQLVAEVPFSYYGVRAGMHLDDGEGASREVLPRPGSPTWTRIRTAYGQAKPADRVEGQTPYHARLQAAASTGLYVQLAAIVDGLGKRFRNRLDNIPLAELDQQNLIAPAAMLLALRLDALAARDAIATAANRLELAALLGTRLGDWPTALQMVAIADPAPRAQQSELEHDRRFLATTYPSLQALPPLAAPLARAAWPIDGSTGLSQSLMYAIIRRESAFYAAALSPVGAIGLFQVMPANFEATPACRQPAGTSMGAAAYLFDPARNVDFWACWIEREGLQPRTVAELPTMLVEHNAGIGNLRSWTRSWQGRAIEQDLELQVDTYRFAATQRFVRSVLTDVAIAQAAGLLESAGATPAASRP